MSLAAPIKSNTTLGGEMEIETEKQMPMETVKKGDTIRMRLIASKTDASVRQANGVHTNDFKGTALSALVVGERFSLDVGFDILTTSTVKHVGAGMFTTNNSTYSFERAP